MKDYVLNVSDASDITQLLQADIKKHSGLNTLILIPPGSYIISHTINIYSGTCLRGAPGFTTKLTLAGETNNNMFTNHDHRKGNHDIKIENICLDGNASKQFKPDNEKRVSFCNIFYFKEGRNIKLSNISVTNCKQTALHFNNCVNITISKLKATGMGWSGISTSGTDNIQATEIYIYDSGKDTRHSAVHFDGGVGSYFDGVIEKCTGNGIMLDSKYSTFNKSVIKAKCIDCKRGVALFGLQQNLISNVLVHYTNVINTEIGILVSNARHVFIANCEITYSSQFGVSLQGKSGGADSVIFNTLFQKNKMDIKEWNNSGRNYFLENNICLQSKNLANREKFISKLNILTIFMQNIIKKLGI